MCTPKEPNGAEINLIASSTPHLSVIVPCYNEEKVIGYCLDSLVQQECDLLYEIIVVDDGSNDETVELVRDFMRKKNPKEIEVRLVAIEHRGPAGARNIGIKNAVGELVLFIDADCFADCNWIKTLTRRAREDDVAGIGGTYITKNPHSRVANFIGFDIEYRHLNMGRYTDFVGSYNACFKKKALLEVGGFDESFEEANAEDNDLCYRILEKGHMLAYEPDARVMHPHPSTIRQFAKQQFKRAMWRVQLYRKRMRWMRGDKYAGLDTLSQPLILALSLLASISVFILAPLSMVPIIVLMVGIICLIVLNIGFLRWVHQRTNIAFTFFSLVMIFLRNVAWCLGACYGLIRFLLLRRVEVSAC